ncbi:hypothetical protein ACFPPA_18505 [Rhodanobacter ginsengisoli]|uniref:Uncharacterized protein n=1 Tax=Rhodanobacter ginsengisoli TaxID=418646 RepID=A0ABW0QW07_9GAMM
MGKPLIVWNEDELASLLEACADLPVIGIDGLKYAGKSRLTDRLGAKLGWQVVHADDFIRFGARPYPEILDLPALSAAIQRPSLGPKLLDSILLGTVLDALSLAPAPFIYVRRRNPSGSLYDPGYYEHFDPEQMLAVAAEQYLLAGANPDEPMLECELIQYHQRYDPANRATAVFENVVSS